MSESGPIEDRYLSVLEGNDFAVPQIFQRAVYVDVRQSGTISQIGLRQRELVAEALRKTNDLEADEQFTEQCRELRACATPAERYFPLAVDCSVKVCRKPVQPSEMRGLPSDFGQAIMGNGCHPARRQRHDRMIEVLERKAVQIGKVTRDVQFRDLPLPIAQIPVSTQYAVKQQRTMSQLDAGVDQYMIGRMFAVFANRRSDRLLVVWRQHVAGAKLRKMTF